MAKETSVTAEADSATPLEVKSILTVDPSLTEKIIKQIEYYFSDVNMSKDKFMQEEIQRDSGWVRLDVLTKFNRLKILTTDFKVILEALKQSTANLLEIDEENNKIRRAKPFPKNLMKLTVYVDLSGLKHQEKVLQKETQEDYLKRQGPYLYSAKLARMKRGRMKNERKKKQREAFYKSQMLLGSVIHLKGLNKKITKDNIKELFHFYFKIKWVDYNKGEPEAYVRFVEENKAQIAINVALIEGNKKLKIKGAKLEYRVLEGEEEQKFLDNAIKKKKRRIKRKNGKDKRSFGNKDADNGSGDGVSADNQSSAAKKQKV